MFRTQVIADGFSETPEGLIYKEFSEGTGDTPTNGQEVLPRSRCHALAAPCQGCLTPITHMPMSMIQLALGPRIRQHSINRLECTSTQWP